MLLADHSTPGLLTVSSPPWFGSTPAGKAAGVHACYIFVTLEGKGFNTPLLRTRKFNCSLCLVPTYLDRAPVINIVCLCVLLSTSQ